MRALTARRTSGILLIGAFFLNMGGVLPFNGSHTFGWFVETPTYLAWERGLFIAAYVVAALGVACSRASCGRPARRSWRDSGPPRS